MHATSLAEWLRQLDEEDLVALLDARPDLATPAPADSSVLATRAGVPASLARACEGLDAFTLTALEALLVAGADTDPTHVDTVASFLGADVTRDEARRAVARLTERAVAWGAPEAISVVPAAREVVSAFPGGLGRSVPELAGVRLDDYALDSDERSMLERLAGGSPIGRTRDASREEPLERARTPVQRLLAQGLLVRHDSETVELPREVAFALRGDRPMGTVEPREPTVATTTKDPSTVDYTAGGEALELLRHTENLIRSWEHSPPDTLRSGGVGVRDVRRAAKELDVDENRATFLIELLAGASLVASSGDDEPQWVPTVQADSWLAAPAERRWAALARAWLDLPRLPGLVGGRDDRDRLIGALSDDVRRSAAPQDRRHVLGVLAEWPSGTGVTSTDELAALLAWRAPRRGGRLRDDLVRWTIAEATSVGVVALGALSSPGRALLEGATAGTTGPGGAEADDTGSAPTIPGAPETAEARAARLMSEALPEPLDHVLVQADLTVVAPGPLEADLAAEISLVADVESGGSATVYRVTEGSVRRALDAGRTAEDIEELFHTRSRTPVPQSLSYLINDVARRHGQLRAGTAASFLRCEDPVALTEVLANPVAGKMELRRIAPTVLISPLPLSDVVDELRGAGFVPAAEGPDGQVLDLRPSGQRVRVRHRPAPTPAATSPNPQHLHEVVRRMRHGDRAAAARRGGAVSPERGRPSAAATLELLRDAARDQRSVWLGFVDSRGTASERIVSPISVGNGVLAGYDQASDSADLHRFPLHRITSVAVVES